jgi:hypothetical protein
MTRNPVRAARAAANPTLRSGTVNRASTLLIPVPQPSAPGPVRRSRAMSRKTAPENGLWGKPLAQPYGGWR